MIATVGRMDQLHDKGRVETLIRSLSRFSEKALLILSGKSDVKANSLTIGPPLIFQRLWEKSGIRDVPLAQVPLNGIAPQGNAFSKRYPPRFCPSHFYNFPTS